MSGHKRWIILLLLLGGGFALGLGALFSLRFSGGDVFPPYSSLRADPLGTKALYEALASLAPREVHRNYLPLQHYRPHPGETLLLLGTNARLLSAGNDEERRRIEQLAEAGARVVVAFTPLPRPRAKRTKAPAGTKPGGAKAKPATARPKMDWDLALGWATPPATEEQTEQAHPATGDVPDEVLPFHGPVRFRSDGPWRADYLTDSGPVVVERAFGAGSVILVAQSYLLSNEAMRRDRHSRFLTWLAGPTGTVVFDESHLGIADSGGLMKLARHFGLQWFFVALLPLAALWAWHNGIPLVPPTAENEPAAAGGRDHFSGLVQLLRRNLPLDRYLDTALGEWRKSAPPHLLAREKRLREILAREQQLRPRQRRPVAAYRAIAKILSERTHR